MMIQPLLPSQSEPSHDGRPPADGESPNEVFARALAESIQATRGAGPDRSRHGIPDGPTRTGFERAESRLDPRSDMAASRPDRADRPERADPSNDRTSRPEVNRSDDHRAGNPRPDDPGPEESRAEDRPARVVVARPGEAGTERPGAQEVDPAGNPVRPETPGSGNGRRVLFAGETTGPDQSGLLDGDDAALAGALASLMGVETGQVVTFLETLMAGLTRAQGVESAEQLMARLAGLAEQLGAGNGIGIDGVDGADTELVAAVIEAAVGAGLVEPLAPEAEADPAALLAALTAAISVAGTDETGVAERAADDLSPGTVTDSDPGTNPDTGTGTDLDGQPIDVDRAGGTGNAESDNTDGGSDPDGKADTGTETERAGDASPPDGGGATGTGTSADDGGPEAAPDRRGTGPAMARAADPSIGATPSAIPGGPGDVSGVGAAGPTSTSPVTAPARTSAQGLVELANTQLAEQLRPAFAAVRRGIDGMEELQLRLRNEGGAPIKVDIRTVDGEIRVVLSGTNDDVMQRLGQERERLAAELRRAGFTSTTVDVHSDGTGGHDRRFGATGTAEPVSGHSYGTNRPIEEQPVGAVSASGGSTASGLDLDL